MSWRRALLGCFVLLLAPTVPAAASTLAGGSSGLGAGGVAVTRCGSLAASTVRFNITSGNVSAVTVANLPATCNGGQLSLALTTGAGVDLGHGGPVPIAAGVATVTALSAAPAGSSVTNARVVVAGP